MIRAGMVAASLVTTLVSTSPVALCSPSPPPPVSPPPVPPAPARPNTVTSDGGVAMSIAAVDCDHPTAAGISCRVAFRAVNVSDGFPVFTESAQRAYDAQGREFRPDPAADLVANHGMPVTQRLQRGVPVSGVLVFDIPAGDRIDRVVLHGRPDSPGETFPL
jgi:hypothetical protein